LGFINTLLLPRTLLLRNNFFFIKQKIVIHIIQWVKKTQVKVLGEELDLPDGLVKALFILLHNLFLVYE